MGIRYRDNIWFYTLNGNIPSLVYNFNGDINKVTRIFTTLRFWLQCVKTPHFLLFYKTGFYALPDEKLHKLFFFSSQVVCLRSIGSVAAIDPVVDSIPEPSIDGCASAVLHLTGTKRFQAIPTTIDLLGSCNFHLSPHSHLLNPFTTFVHHGPHNQTYYVIPKYIT